MIATSVVETIADRIERELERVKAARPALASRISRAEGILVTHLSCRRQRLIRVRVRDGRARFLVSGSGASGAVYVVDPASWACSCPDHHRRGAGCKHSIACWALWRASARPALPGAEVAADLGGLEHVGEIVERAALPVARLRSCAGCSELFRGRDLFEVGDDDLTFFEGDELCRSCARAHDVL